WTSQCTYRKTRLEEGTILFNFAGSGGNKVPRDFFPDGHDFMFAGNDESAREKAENPYLSNLTLYDCPEDA
ncbi:MAG: hypothetical protein J6X61_05375, partial [Clostridia bacterium]|nr:hypothetical protein [Clostridia bacterium]